MLAYHRAGHAIVCWNLQYADVLLKVTCFASAIFIQMHGTGTDVRGFFIVDLAGQHYSQKFSTNGLCTYTAE
jgi:hypothetical protein